MHRQRALEEVKVLQTKEIIPFYNLLKANIRRSHMTITSIFIKANSLHAMTETERIHIEHELTVYLSTIIRDTDLLFKLDDPLQWGILLTKNGEIEAKAFLNRLFQMIQDETDSVFTTDQMTMQGVVFEIKNEEAEFEQLLKQKEHSFETTTDQWAVNVVTDFKTQAIETVKVSILEDNDIFQDVLQKIFGNLQVENVNVQIQSFKDGYEFLSSDWYKSSHTHIVLMNDVLPRKNGLEVLHALRNMANQKKFIVYMMTKRKSQVDMIYAYESGVDEYLLKPFNTQLLEAQLKRTFERLWL